MVLKEQVANLSVERPKGSNPLPTSINSHSVGIGRRAGIVQFALLAKIVPLKIGTGEIYLVLVQVQLMRQFFNII